jgi:hypothetical protein
MYVHNYSGKHFTLYVKNNFRIVLFYSCVFYILLYIYISSLKNPLKLASKRLAKCSYCQSFIFRKIYDPPPWGHPIPVGPGAAWSKLTPLPQISIKKKYPRWALAKNVTKGYRSAVTHVFYHFCDIMNLIYNYLCNFLQSKVLCCLHALVLWNVWRHHFTFAS